MRCVFEHVLRTIGDSVGLWLYAIAGAFCFGEAAILIGLVLPGETALLVAGVFCNPKYGQPHALGDDPGRGRSARSPATASGTNSANGSAPHCDAPGWAGGSASNAGRWSTVSCIATVARPSSSAGCTAVLRALMPSMAGMSGMRYRTFLTWNAAGGLLWGTGCVLLGYAFATALNVVGQTLTWAPLALLAVAVLVYLLLHMRRRRRERAEAAAFAESDAVNEH